MSQLKMGDSKSQINKVRQLLAQSVGQQYNVDQGVAFHTDPKYKISLPEGMSLEKADQTMHELIKAGQQMVNFTRQFRFRPLDGAAAVQRVLENQFGTTGRGKSIMTFFGEIKPETKQVWVGVDETINVPWGQVSFALLEGTLSIGSFRDPEYGPLFHLSIECPKRLEYLAEAFANMVQAELEQNSIYRGKAIIGTGDQPQFLPISPNPTIVYNQEVENALYTEVWGVIENRELLKSDHRKVNARVLMHGPYGTGKSEAGMRTAVVAVENNTTFIQFRTGGREGTLDALENTINMARLYSPAVVFVEDVDVFAAEGTDDAYQSRLSNLFDGINSKGDEVLIVMTSNKAASFSKAMLRAGRIDAMIEVGALNREATEEMARRVIGVERLAKDLDFDKIWAAMEGFEPAFVRQVFDKAAKAALLRTKSREYTLSTEDFVAAAHLLRPQHDQHANKSDATKKVTFDSLMRDTIMRAADTVIIERLSGAGTEDELTLQASEVLDRLGTSI